MNRISYPKCVIFRKVNIAYINNFNPEAIDINLMLIKLIDKFIYNIFCHSGSGKES